MKIQFPVKIQFAVNKIQIKIRPLSIDEAFLIFVLDRIMIVITYWQLQVPSMMPSGLHVQTITIFVTEIKVHDKFLDIIKI